MDYILTALKRDVLGKKVKVLRQNGLLPAVVYGKDHPAEPLTLNSKQFVKLFMSAGTSTIITLEIKDGKKIKVLVRDPHLDPVRLTPMHVDLQQINMKEKIRTEIPLEFVGASPAVVDQDGKLITSLDALEVECLPDDLVQHIAVDLSSLKEFDDAIHVSDLTIPHGIEVLTDPELSIVVIQAPISEEEFEAELAEAPSEEEAVAGVAVEEKAPETEVGAESAPVTEGSESHK